MMFVYFMDVNLVHLFASFIYFISSYSCTSCPSITNNIIKNNIFMIILKMRTFSIGPDEADL